MLFMQQDNHLICQLADVEFDNEEIKELNND